MSPPTNCRKCIYGLEYISTDRVLCLDCGEGGNAREVMKRTRILPRMVIPPDWCKRRVSE